MKIIGTKSEIKAFQILASKSALDIVMKVEVMYRPLESNKYFIEFMDEPIEFFKEAKDEED